MALNIKNAEVEQLAGEVAQLANETKTEAIRRALLERKARLDLQQSRLPRILQLQRFLEQRVWPTIPEDVIGRSISKQDEEEILGYGPGGF